MHHNQQPPYQDPVPSAPPQPAPQHKSHPSDPYYGHEELSRVCARFIRHVFNCPPDSNQPLLPNGKPTESTISLARFIAYGFHRTRLPSSVAYHALFLLSRLKARYPAASCAFGHRLFLTSYMLSSKVICDDTYSNKSWAIVGQGFYDLRDVNLMEREMIHYLSWDLTISGPDLATFTDRVKATYRKGVPKTAYVVVPDTSREKDHFGKGSIEVEKKPVISVDTSRVIPSDAPPSYSTAYPTISNTSSPDDEVLSPYTNSSNSSSRQSSPPSPCLKTPPDEVNTVGASPIHKRGAHGDFADLKHSVAQMHIVGDRETAIAGPWASGTVW